MIEKIFFLAMCHLVGDYVLQSDYIAKTKAQNWYHLIVHCVLYILPFYLFFGVTWHLAVLFITHIVIDALKAKYGKLSYTQDQVLHYLVCAIYLLK